MFQFWVPPQETPAPGDCRSAATPAEKKLLIQKGRRDLAGFAANDEHVSILSHDLIMWTKSQPLL